MGFSLFFRVPINGRGRAGPTVVYRPGGRGGCGCFSAIGLMAVLFVGFCLFKACEGPRAAKDADSAAQVPEPRASEVDAEFRKRIGDILAHPDSYRPGETKFHSHTNGYAYLHAFQSKNDLGEFVIRTAGLLAATNTGAVTWKFYAPGHTRELMLGTPVGDAIKELSAYVNETPSTATETAPRPAETDAEHRARVTAKARELIAPKLKDPASFTPLTLERRIRGEDTVWVQFLRGDGRKRRTGISGSPVRSLTLVGSNPNSAQTKSFAPHSSHSPHSLTKVLSR